MNRDLHQRIGLLPPNRVWRTYPGGRLLDRLQGKAAPADTHFPEDWIGSTTRAINPGRETEVEGIATAIFGPHRVNLRDVIEADPDYFLGEAHTAAYGTNPMVLVKFIDSADRLHLQAHPTAAFARKHLGSPSGKTEAYVILSSRETVPDPHIYLGFQRPPRREDLKHWIENQNMEALIGCFDRIPVRPGDAFIIPGGFPHALGEGLFLVEIQEPSDLVVRFEFERSGFVIPESARFMGRGLDFCLDVFDFRATPVAQVLADYRPKPVVQSVYGDGSMLESVIGPRQTECFAVERLRIRERLELGGGRFSVNIVTEGSCRIADAHGTIELRQYDRFLCPYGLDGFEVKTETGVEILRSYPPVVA
ncbi:MAG: class I mannose-6-phosphate isomerase [Opitutaceae bacterium]